jgi:hypothetical protein
MSSVFKKNIVFIYGYQTKARTRISLWRYLWRLDLRDGLASLASHIQVVKVLVFHDLRRVNAPYRGKHVQSRQGNAVGSRNRPSLPGDILMIDSTYIKIHAGRGAR